MHLVCLRERRERERGREREREREREGGRERERERERERKRCNYGSILTLSQNLIHYSLDNGVYTLEFTCTTSCTNYYSIIANSYRTTLVGGKPENLEKP